MPPDIAPQDTAAYRAAKLAVIILSVLIVAAVIALVVGGIAKLGGKSRAAAPGSAATFQLPPGARIVEMQSQPGRLILRLRGEGGDEIVLLDTQDGRLVSRIRAMNSP